VRRACDHTRPHLLRFDSRQLKQLLVHNDVGGKPISVTRVLVFLLVLSAAAIPVLDQFACFE
jgi:hypothetical protein